jgi:hypothetical protein
MTADKYMDLTKGLNYNDGRVSAPVFVPCWLEEGTITVNSASTIQYEGTMLAMPSQSYASPLTQYSLVQLALDGVTPGAFTFDAMQGKPVVSAVSGSGGVVGELITYPTRPVHTPTSTKSAIADRVSGLYYRVGTVRLLGMQYQPVLVKNSASTGAIVPGNALKYDVSDGMWKLDSSSPASPVISCHYANSSSDIYVGALFTGGAAVSQS